MLGFRFPPAGGDSFLEPNGSQINKILIFHISTFIYTIIFILISRPVSSRIGSHQGSFRFKVRFKVRFASFRFKSDRVASMMLVMMVMMVLMMMMMMVVMTMVMMMMVMMLPSHHPSFLPVRSVELWLAASEPDFLAIGRGCLGFTSNIN